MFVLWDSIKKQGEAWVDPEHWAHECSNDLAAFHIFIDFHETKS